MDFFSKKVEEKHLDAGFVQLSKNKHKVSHREEQMNHRDILIRILYVFVRTNVAIGYAQGMNEIVCIFYYCFCNYGLSENPLHIEADTFWCFFNLITIVSFTYQYKDNYIFGMSSQDHPMRQILTKYEKYLEVHQTKSFRRLKELSIQPDYYAYRWFLLFFTQEFDIMDLMRLWDSMFCFFKKDSKTAMDVFLISVSLAIIGLVEQEILAGELNSCMTVLQKHRTPIRPVIASAGTFFKKIAGKSIEQFFGLGKD